MGIHDPMGLDARRFVSLVSGWLFDGRTKEEREELTRLFEGESATVDRALDSSLADTYREDGMNDLQVEMMEEMRHATSPMERAEIKVKYHQLASQRIGDK